MKSKTTQTVTERPRFPNTMFMYGIIAGIIAGQFWLSIRITKLEKPQVPLPIAQAPAQQWASPLKDAYKLKPEEYQLSYIELGYRDDGVVVWRKIEGEKK